MVGDYKIIRSNLSRSDKYFDDITDMRACHIEQAAHLVAESYTDYGSFFANTKFIGEYRAATSILFDGKISNGGLNGEFSALRHSQCSDIEKAFFAFCIYNEIRRNGKVEYDSFFETEKLPYRKNRVCFVENPRTEQAFEKIKCRVPLLEKAICRDFDEVCDSVSSHDCEFCLLPIRNSEDGELGSFARMISNYGLKKSLLTQIYLQDDKFTEYALLSANVRRLSDISLDGGKKIYLEFMTSFDQTAGIAEFLSVSRLFGVEPYSIKSVYGAYNFSDKNRYLISMCLEKRDLEQILFCLFLDFPNITVSGLYSII